MRRNSLRGNYTSDELCVKEQQQQGTKKQKKNQGVIYSLALGS